MKLEIENAKKILWDYYNILMDNHNGNASEEAIYEYLYENFKHVHVNNGVDDSCKECGMDLRCRIHSVRI